MSFVPISYKEVGIGNYIAKTTKEFSWKFTLNEVYHLVQVLSTYYTGWKQVKHNGAILYEGGSYWDNVFIFDFIIDEEKFSIVLVDTNFELRINN